jgi:hypothetical protein
LTQVSQDTINKTVASMVRAYRKASPEEQVRYIANIRQNVLYSRSNIARAELAGWQAVWTMPQGLDLARWILAADEQFLEKVA